MSDQNSSGGIGFFGMLTILFIGLKLANIIEWNWWWVLSPILIPITLLFIILLIGVLIGLFELIYEVIFDF